MDKYNLWMCSIPDIGRESIRKLLMYFEDAKEVFKAPDTEIQKCIFLEEGTREAVLRSRKKWNFERAEHEIKEKGIRFISFENPLYPERLKSLPDYPYGLFLKGRLPEEDRLSVAIIGARKCSAYGKRMAEEIAEELSWAGVQIISGMAYGVDGYAQSAALDAGGSSFAVLGSGADVCYPDGNWRLYEELCERGGIISEYPPGTPPISWHFPMRNRIVSGLADAVIVVEAKERSGSLITADLALDQGREIYAVPGRMTDTLSVGCNRLISMGAGIVVSVEKLLEDFGLNGKMEKKSGKQKIVLETRENIVYSCLDFCPLNLQELLKRTGLSLQEVTESLMTLELKGLAEETTKNYYVKINQ